jgi:hypothetical protein
MNTAMVASMALSPQSPAVKPDAGQLDWHIVLETSADGQVVAWVAEWPDCRVTAAEREGAIEAVRQALAEKLKVAEVLSLAISTTPADLAEHPVMKFVGALKDDPKFIAWSDAFWAEKQRSHDGEEVLSLEEFLQES